MFYVWFEKIKLCCYVLLHFFCLPSFFYWIYCLYHCSFVTMGCAMLLVHAIAPTTTWPLLCPIWEKESWFFCFATLLTHAIVFLFTVRVPTIVWPLLCGVQKRRIWLFCCLVRCWHLPSLLCYNYCACHHFFTLIITWHVLYGVPL